LPKIDLFTGDVTCLFKFSMCTLGACERCCGRNHSSEDVVTDTVGLGLDADGDVFAGEPARMALLLLAACVYHARRREHTSPIVGLFFLAVFVIVGRMQ